MLIAAFAVASLLTMAAVARRVPEFGTLKALGWRSRRIVGQVLGESVGTGILGGSARRRPRLRWRGHHRQDRAEAVRHRPGRRRPACRPRSRVPAAPGRSAAAPAASHATIAVPMSASVTVGAIVLAVLLAVAGGLVAGSFGGWRAARLRPAAALARVA